MIFLRSYWPGHKYIHHTRKLSINQNEHERQKKTIIISFAIAAVGFLVAPQIFHEAQGSPAPTSAQMPFLIVLGVVEALSMGYGAAFLFVNWKRAGDEKLRLTHFSIFWLIGSWWVHDGLHRMNGENLNGLILIEYGFHVTLIIAAVIVARYFLRTVRG